MKIVIDGVGDISTVECDVTLLYVAVKGHGTFPKDTLLMLDELAGEPTITIWADPKQIDPTHVIVPGKKED